MPEQWQVKCAERMTRTLARKPRNGKTRAYMATLPKRPTIIVSPNDYPCIISRADARLNVAVRAMRDAQRYADWEQRGKPPSPCLPRKDRVRPRRTQDPLRVLLHEAQEGRCGLCGDRIHEAREGTLDHVVPRALGGCNAGNLLLAHAICNNVKADRPPTRVEIAMLALVNERLAIAMEARQGTDPKGLDGEAATARAACGIAQTQSE